MKISMKISMKNINEKYQFFFLPLEGNSCKVLTVENINEKVLTVENINEKEICTA